MIKEVTNAHLEPISYLSEPSDVPYSPNQFLGWDFFCCFLQQTSSSLFVEAVHDKKKVCTDLGPKYQLYFNLHQTVDILV